jgi:glycine cleavage system H protein
MTIPADLRYTSSHEWARREADGTVSVGITHHAQDRLGDIVYVEPPALGKRLEQGQECGVVESVKAAADIYAPLSGEVVAANEALGSAPEAVNQDAYAAWMFRLRLSEPAQWDGLLDAAAYATLVESESH